MGRNGNLNEEYLKQILESFLIKSDDIISIESMNAGRINTSFRITLSNGKRYTLQKVNTGVFKNPYELMLNIRRVTSHLEKKNKPSLKLNATKDGKWFFINEENGDCWRLYDFVDAEVKAFPSSSKDLYSLGFAIGDFSRSLSDFPASTLFETIKEFHDTKSRFEHFISSKKDPRNAIRLIGCFEDICFIIDRKEICGLIVDDLKSNVIPTRVCHNDPKIGNILFDENGNVICLIDLDTIMPGSILYDFGDAVRSTCNTASEEESDLTKVKLNLDNFKQITKGLIDSMGTELTSKEVELLPASCLIMTLELAIRFLDDHIAGDKYFKVDKHGDNLRRARVQIALAKEIETHFEEMTEIVSKLRKNTIK